MNAEAGQEQFYSPQLGKIYSYVFDVELMIECATQASGAVYDMQIFSLGNRDFLVAGINAHVKVYWIESDVPELDEKAEIDS